MLEYNICFFVGVWVGVWGVLVLVFKSLVCFDGIGFVYVFSCLLFWGFFGFFDEIGLFCVFCFVGFMFFILIFNFKKNNVEFEVFNYF